LKTIYNVKSSLSLAPPLWNFGISKKKITPFVCALFVLVCDFNPVVYAQPLPKLFNFQSGVVGDMLSPPTMEF